ncbi:hypothetical protein KJ596_04445 [Patescibacteria group bacterium]|nr:hypothetical protein [Patescibacteria group bacterium]MBU1868025.1 hypothetical protein [Patescibacteria group bacterium]
MSKKKKKRVDEEEETADDREEIRPDSGGDCPVVSHTYTGDVGMHHRFSFTQIRSLRKVVQEIIGPLADGLLKPVTDMLRTLVLVTALLALAVAVTVGYVGFQYGKEVYATRLWQADADNVEQSQSLTTLQDENVSLREANDCLQEQLDVVPTADEVEDLRVELAGARSQLQDEQLRTDRLYGQLVAARSRIFAWENEARSEDTLWVPDGYVAVVSSEDGGEDAYSGPRVISDTLGATVTLIDIGPQYGQWLFAVKLADGQNIKLAVEARYQRGPDLDRTLRLYQRFPEMLDDRELGRAVGIIVWQATQSMAGSWTLDEILHGGEGHTLALLDLRGDIIEEAGYKLGEFGASINQLNIIGFDDPWGKWYGPPPMDETE